MNEEPKIRIMRYIYRPKLWILISFITTGTITTLATKWTNQIKSKTEGQMEFFRHPHLQNGGNLLAESLFFIVHLTRRHGQGNSRNRYEQGKASEVRENTNLLILLIPAFLQVCGTSIMYVGLTLTSASSYQMLMSGSFFVFTNILSGGRSSSWAKRCGILLVITGVVSVVMVDHYHPEAALMKTNTSTPIQKALEASAWPHATDMAIGDMLIIFAQIIVAFQVVYEEKFIANHNIDPLLLVGCEGLYGFCMMSLLFIPMYYVEVEARFGQNPNKRIEDVDAGIDQISNSWKLSFAFFLFVGTSAMFKISRIIIAKKRFFSTTRVKLDTLRTLLVWTLALVFSWESYCHYKLVCMQTITTGIYLYTKEIFDTN